VIEQSAQPQPGQPGGPRRAPTVAPPVVRARQEPPVVQVRPPGGLTRVLEQAQSYILSEETLVLIQFLVVVLIGVVVFRAVLHPMENLVESISKAIGSLGIFKK